VRVQRCAAVVAWTGAAVFHKNNTRLFTYQLGYRLLKKDSICIPSHGTQTWAEFPTAPLTW
jgi:hypothetical protein